MNIPITRTVNNMVSNAEPEPSTPHQMQNFSPKRVRWSPELTQVRDISPRYKSAPFRFISPNRSKQRQTSCQHFQCTPGQPCRQTENEEKRQREMQERKQHSSSKLPCSPQLQKVVYRAVNNNYGGSSNYSNNNSATWKPDRYNLSLNIRPTLV